MDAAGLREAYATLVAEANRGGFGAPDDGGWSAERVVAHVNVNDGLLTTVTERLLAGQDASLNNAPATDPVALDEVVARCGDLLGVAAAVRKSGDRLCGLLEQLDDTTAATLVPTRIADGAEVVVDQPMPWAVLMQVQEHRHLVAHTEQLRALRG